MRQPKSVNHKSTITIPSTWCVGISPRYGYVLSCHVLPNHFRKNKNRSLATNSLATDLSPGWDRPALRRSVGEGGDAAPYRIPPPKNRPEGASVAPVQITPESVSLDGSETRRERHAFFGHGERCHMWAPHGEVGSWS